MPADSGDAVDGALPDAEGAGTETVTGHEDGKVVAIVRGRELRRLPTDLYIPPDALAVILETFEGPLDLLLYLIRRQNLDILEISVSAVTDQYINYIELMAALELDLAGEYLLMAATLAEIKSRLLLPRAAEDDEEEEDPRAELVRRLREYERFKEAAERLDRLPRLERDTHLAHASRPEPVARRAQPAVALDELLDAFAAAMARAELSSDHTIEQEPLSVRERMTDVLARVNEGFVTFTELLDASEGRRGIVVTFLALMQLLQEALVEVVQTREYGPIHVRPLEEAERVVPGPGTKPEDAGPVPGLVQREA